MDDSSIAPQIKYRRPVRANKKQAPLLITRDRQPPCGCNEVYSTVAGIPSEIKKNSNDYIKIFKAMVNVKILTKVVINVQLDTNLG